MNPGPAGARRPGPPKSGSLLAMRAGLRFASFALVSGLMGPGCADDGDDIGTGDSDSGGDVDSDSGSGSDSGGDTTGGGSTDTGTGGGNGGTGPGGTTDGAAETTGDTGPTIIDIDLELNADDLPPEAYAIVGLNATPRVVGNPRLVGETRVEPLDAMRIPVQIELAEGWDPGFIYRFAIRGRIDGTPDEDSDCSDFAIDRNRTDELTDPEAFVVVFTLVRETPC